MYVVVVFPIGACYTDHFQLLRWIPRKTQPPRAPEQTGCLLPTPVAPECQHAFHLDSGGTSGHRFGYIIMPIVF